MAIPKFENIQNPEPFQTQALWVSDWTVVTYYKQKMHQT
jgi:hypothetical protein